MQLDELCLMHCKLGFVPIYLLKASAAEDFINPMNPNTPQHKLRNRVDPKPYTQSHQFLSQKNEQKMHL